MTTQETINGITYNIKAESPLEGENLQNGWHVSIVILKRPRGHKEFWGMRNIEGGIEILN